MVTVPQFMRKLGLSGNGAYVRRMCAQGRIRGAVKVGRDWLIPDKAVIAPPKQNKKAATG